MIHWYWLLAALSGGLLLGILLVLCGIGYILARMEE